MLQLIKNPAFKWLFKDLIRHVNKKRRLELLIEKYIGENGKKMSIRNYFYYFIIIVVIRIAEVISKSKENNLKASLKVRHIRILFIRSLALIYESIEEFGLPKKMLRWKSPFTVVWEISHKCNLKCKHCSAATRRIDERELNTDEAKRVIDQLAEAGVCLLLFSGGEPLLREDFFELCSHAVDKGLAIGLASNGTLITKEIAKRLKKIGFYSIQISLDGATAETHDSFRSVPGSFDKAIEGIKNCIEQEIEISVAPTITNSNCEELEEIIYLAKRIGAVGVNIYNFIPTGNGKLNSECDVGFEKRQIYLNLMHKIKEEMAGKIRISSATTMEGFRVLIENEGKSLVKVLEFFGGCPAGRAYCAIEPNGDIYPCVFMPIAVGNLRSHSLNDIWHESGVLKELRDRELLKGGCAKCDVKYACGGCRSMAYAYYNDYLESDPTCPYNKGSECGFQHSVCTSKRDISICQRQRFGKGKH